MSGQITESRPDGLTKYIQYIQGTQPPKTKYTFLF